MVLQCHVCFCPVHSVALFVFLLLQCHVLPRNCKFLSNNSFGESSISSFNDMSRFAHSCSASEKLLLRRGPHFLSNKLTFGLISFNVILSRDFSKQQRSHFWLCLFWRHVALYPPRCPWKRFFYAIMVSAILLLANTCFNDMFRCTPLVVLPRNCFNAVLGRDFSKQ